MNTHTYPAHSEHIFINAPRSLGRTCSSPFSSTNQGSTGHCLGFAHTNMLIMKLIELYPDIVTHDISILLFKYYLFRMTSDPSSMDGVNPYYINTFILELNNGILYDIVLNNGIRYNRVHSTYPVEQNMYKIKWPIPTFMPHYIEPIILDTINKITQRLKGENRGISLKLQYITKKMIRDSVNLTLDLTQFIGLNVSTISIKFNVDGSNIDQLTSGKRDIVFDTTDVIRPDYAAHAMLVRSVVDIWNQNRLMGKALQLINSWGSDWGNSIGTATSNVSYFLINDEIIKKFINYVSFLEIVRRENQLISHGRDTYPIRYGFGVTKRNKKQKNKKNKSQQKKSQQKKRRTHKR